EAGRVACPDTGVPERRGAVLRNPFKPANRCHRGVARHTPAPSGGITRPPRESVSSDGRVKPPTRSRARGPPDPTLAPMKLDAAPQQEQSGLRLKIFAVLILFVIGMLTVRLAQMQLLDRAQYTDEAMANSVEQKVVEPARGLIYD